jgi:hypothetical protein
VAARLDPLAALLEDDPPLLIDAERHHVLLSPAFHHEALVTIDLAPRPGVRVRVYASSVYIALLERRRSPARPIALPIHHEARAALAPARAKRLRQDLARDLPGLSIRADVDGRDGVGLSVAVLRGDAPPRRFDAWSPELDHPQRAYFATVLDLAADVLTDPCALRCIGDLHGYLDLGLPARDRGGYPRCLQLFGRVTAADRAALASFLAVASPTEAVVVDMRHCDVLGSALHPPLHEFSRRSGAIAWAVSPDTRRVLREARVPSNQMREDLADAVLLATVNDARRR